MHEFKEQELHQIDELINSLNDLRVTIRDDDYYGLADYHDRRATLRSDIEDIEGLWDDIDMSISDDDIGTHNGEYAEEKMLDDRERANDINGR